MFFPFENMYFYETSRALESFLQEFRVSGTSKKASKGRRGSLSVIFFPGNKISPLL
jgi:hypothetical protein